MFTTQKLGEKMHKVDIIINSDIIIPVIPTNTVWHDKAIVINNGLIIDIIEQSAASNKYIAQEVHNLPGQAIIPGLINAHTHVPMNLFRGLADDLQLFDWLQNHIWPAEAEVLCEESSYIGAQLAIAEMLLGGTTCFYDMFFFTESIIKATSDAGMRAILGLNIMDISNKWAQSCDECLEKSRKIIEQNYSPLINLALAPQGPYTNSDESLIKVRQMADKHNLRIMIHMHETAREIKESIDKFGKRPLKRLDDIGFLGPDVMAVHMVHINDEDFAITTSNKLNISHCPESNLKLASGFANMARLRDAGLNIAIGTDSVASNNDLDMFGEMRQAAFIAKAITGNPTTFAAHETLEMATLGAAKAMGMAEKIGSLEIGKKADITAIDLNDPQTQPLYSPISQIIYAANRKQVSHVWVDGKLKVKNHKLIDMDNEKLLKQAAKFIASAAKYRYPSS
jgi:5-methylthioadenosine/S-adenosylhomocysteine deaminase